MRFISRGYVDIRKSHNCWGCMREFEKGETMLRVVSVDQDIMSVYWCDDCDEYLSSEGGSVDGDDGYLYGELLNDDVYRNSLAFDRVS